MNPSSENIPRERLFELAFQSASIGMALVGLDGRWLRVNQALCRLVGYSETELLALTFQDITHPEDLDSDLTLLGQLLRDEIETYDLEKRYLRKDGRVIWILLSVSLARDEHYAPAVFVSQIQDISGRKLAEKARETLFRLPVALHFVAGFDGYFKELSPSWADLLGYSSEVLLSIPYLDLVHPDDRERTIEEAARTTRGANTFLFENRYRRSDGSYRWLVWVSTTVIEDQLVYGVALDSTARKDAEEALRLFRNLVDQSNDTVEVIDPQSGRFLDVNANGPTELGYSREEYLSLRVVDIDPTIPEAAWPQLAAQIRAAGSLSAEGNHQRKDGSTFPVEINAKWVHLDRDYIVAVIRNISGRKKVEAQLHESERRFRELLENVNLLALIVDCEGTILFCNDCLLKLSGWSLEEALGANWFSKFIPCCPQVKELYLKTVKAGKMPAHYENPIQTKSGELRDIVWNNTILRDGLGKIVGTAAIGTDVTERKRNEEHMREQASMLNHAHEAIIVRDIHTHLITFWNQGAERLYGWSAAEAHGQDIGKLIFEDPSVPRNVSAELIKSGEWHGEQSHFSKTGKKLTISGNATLVRDTLGEPKAVLIINIDITQQKELEAQFLRAQRLESIGTLASGLAHDLNNILSPIMISASLLRDQVSEQQREKLIDILEFSAARGAQIIRQVLTFGCELEVKKSRMQIDILVRELLKIIRETFPRNLVIENEFKADLWPIFGDATQIHQVLLNLCVNARDAMPEGGRLRFEACNLLLDVSSLDLFPEATPGPYLRLEVRDTGSGIPPETLERIFDPFFTTKGVGKGSGLGLSSALGIVKSHGGFIRVNTRLGSGTTFHIYLPASPHADEAIEHNPAMQITHGAGQLVLVVDDEVNVRATARLVLETAGYRVLVASDGVEGLAVFAMNSGSVAVVLSDLMMPLMDGVAFLRSLRMMAPDLPIIVATGLGEGIQRAALITMNVHIILSKPYRPDTLLRAIHSTLIEAPTRFDPTLM